MFLERSSYISENQINKVVKIHNGKEFVEVLVIKSIVGIKAGCFAPTRKPRKNKK
nr:ribosomal protein S19 [Schizochytrium sp. TIO1101]